MELPDKPELERKFKALSREQRIELIRDCEKKGADQSWRKKTMSFFMASNKMLAEPQLLNKEVNLEQLKAMMTEYGMQFHLKELPDQSMELHFFAKDANIASHAIRRTIDTIVNDPSTVTKPTLESLIKDAKDRVKEKAAQVEQAKESTVQLSQIGGEVGDSAKEAKEALDALSLFESSGGIEL